MKYFLLFLMSFTFVATSTYGHDLVVKNHNKACKACRTSMVNNICMSCIKFNLEVTREHLRLGQVALEANLTQYHAFLLLSSLIKRTQALSELQNELESEELALSANKLIGAVNQLYECLDLTIAE